MTLITRPGEAFAFLHWYLKGEQRTVRNGLGSHPQTWPDFERLRWQQAALQAWRAGTWLHSSWESYQGQYIDRLGTDPAAG